MITARAGEVIYLPAGSSNLARAEQDAAMVYALARLLCAPSTWRRQRPAPTADETARTKSRRTPQIDPAHRSRDARTRPSTGDNTRWR